MRRILLMLFCLTTSACAGFDAVGVNLKDAAPPTAVSPAPEGQKLAELANQAFATAKLTGAPEISAVRATHDNQWGDWMFCIRSSYLIPPSPEYAVLVGHDAVLAVRSSVLIDGCEGETYHPLAPTRQHGKGAAHK